MTHNPLDLVMVMLGTNDTKQRFGLSAQAIAHNLKEFVRIVRSYALDELGRPPKILVIAPPLIGDWLEGTIFYGHFGPEAPAKSRELSPPRCAGTPSCWGAATSTAPSALPPVRRTRCT